MGSSNESTAQTSPLMHMTDVVVHRKLLLEITLVRKDVNHPRKNLGEKGSAFDHAGGAGMDGAEHAELRVLAKVLIHLAGRSAAEICVLVPTHHAEGNSSVQLVLGSIGACGEHDAFEGEAFFGCAVIEQRSGARGIEHCISVFGVGIVVEMKL